MIKRNKKKIALIILSSLLVGILSVGTVMATMNAKTEILNNEISFETAKINIDEGFNGWNAKTVRLQNVSNKIPGVVRAMLVIRFVDDDGNYVSMDTEPLSAPANGMITNGDFNFILASDWQDNWFYKDGYFYYKKVLPPQGEQTSYLLEKVEVSKTCTESDYEGLNIKVDVIANIIQAEGSGPETEWGVKVNGLTVSA